MEHSKKINMLCRSFRINILKKTLAEVGNSSSVKVTTLSAFEQGYSTNIKIMLAYVKAATPEQRDIFYNGLKIILGDL